MTNTEIKQNDTQKQNKRSLVPKIIAIIFWVLSVASFLLLIKTELRKWLVFEGEPSPANSVVFWIALGLGVLFAYLGERTEAIYKQKNARIEKIIPESSKIAFTEVAPKGTGSFKGIKKASLEEQEARSKALDLKMDLLAQAMVQNLRRNTTQDDIKNDKDVLKSGNSPELVVNGQEPSQNHTKRLISLISTAGKTKEQIKLEAKQAYQKFLQSQQQKPQESQQPQPPPSSEKGMTDEEFQKIADQLGQAMVQNLQYHTTHDDMNMASIEEKLAKLDKEYPFVPSTNAGRLFSMVRRMKAEKEMGIPINYRSSRIISVNPSLKESKRTNEMSEQKWESFYKNLSEQLERGYPELYRKAVG